MEKIHAYCPVCEEQTGFINRKTEQPFSSSSLHNQWSGCNDLVISYILNAMGKDITHSVLYAPTTKQIWDELIDIFGQADTANLYQIQKEINNHTQGGIDIEMCFTRAKGSCDELDNLDIIPSCSCKNCTCELGTKMLKFHQKLKAIKFLMGLNDSYANISGIILMVSPMPPIGQIYSLLIQEERLRDYKIRGQSLIETSAFFASVKERLATQLKSVLGYMGILTHLQIQILRYAPFKGRK